MLSFAAFISGSVVASNEGRREVRQYIARCSAVVVKILRAGLRSIGVDSGRFVGTGSRGADAVAASSNQQINNSFIAIRVQNAVQILIE
eukprot:COSAG05_NODE_328_length_11337_cov_252.011805_6_plen_89_part_00